MKIEVNASQGAPEQLRVSGLTKIAMIAGVLGIGGLMFGNSVSAMSHSDAMVINPVYQQYLQDVSVGRGANWKLIPNKYKYIGDYGGKGSDAALPASYNLVEDGYGTTLKNQGFDGDCWAFATTTAIESNLKKTQGITTEISPKQLDYLMAEGSPYYSFLHDNFGVSRSLGEGGNFAIASFAAGGKSTPILEKNFFAKMQANDPELEDYSSWYVYQTNLVQNAVLNEIENSYFDFDNGFAGGSYTESMNIESVMDEPDYTVAKYRHYMGDKDLVETIKEDVYQYGAVYVGTIAPGTEDCYDEDTKTIVDLGSNVCSEESGHAMAIVGWDDNHTYTDPSDGSTKTGAFLLQNSWGKSDIFDGSNEEFLDIDDILFLAAFDAESEFSEDEEEEVRSMLENYDADEYVWFGYDFDDSESGWVDFASIQETKKNNYDKVYDSINQAEGLGTEGKSTESVYTFSTDGATEYVDAISVATHLAAYNADVEYVVYVDPTGTGNSYKEEGSVIIPMGEMGQETVELKSPVEVTGTFKVKVEGKAFGEVQEFDNEDLAYRTVTVYVTGDDIVVPNTAGVDEVVLDATAPNTGLFTGENSFARFGGVVAIASMITASLFGRVAYKNRKSLFHRVGFKKKGF